MSLVEEEWGRKTVDQNRNINSKVLMLFTYMVFDLTMLVLSMAAAVLLRSLWGWIEITYYTHLYPVLLLTILVFFGQGLYSLAGINPAEEIRRIVIGCSLVMFAGTFAGFFLRGGIQYSRAVLLMFWFFSMALIPIGRYFCREVGARFRYWGLPVAIFSTGERGREIAESLLQNRKSGFRPVAYLVPEKQHGGIVGCETGLWDEADKFQARFGLDSAIRVMEDVPDKQWIDTLDRKSSGFRRIFFIPEAFGARSLWVSPVDIVGNLGMELQMNLASPGSAAFKRIWDLCLASLMLVFVFPVMAVIAIAVRLDSPGNAIYTQERLGRGGKLIRVYKFRTMTADADRRLKELLETDEAARVEWEQFQKLENDPRITRMGKWLRRWSLDELPQILNVIHGEMSLIGPRPIVQEEVSRYSHQIRLYNLVRPGLTGLWQVSGRSTLSYERRVALDAYYVRNWSLWIDLYILAKTPLVLLRGDGR